MQLTLKQHRFEMNKLTSTLICSVINTTVLYNSRQLNLWLFKFVSVELWIWRAKCKFLYDCIGKSVPTIHALFKGKLYLVLQLFKSDLESRKTHRKKKKPQNKTYKMSLN